MFSIGKFKKIVGVDTKNTKEMFKYNKLIYSQISNIVKTPESQSFVGLPFNIILEKSK